MPLSSLGHTLNHEYGHLARLPDDAGGRVHLGVTLPFLGVDGSAEAHVDRDVTAREQLAVQSGGWEADELALRLTRDMHYEGERATTSTPSSTRS
jgi:hypothetical protein